MALYAGQRLGSYEIRSALGAGGMGEVYRARDMRLDRDVAIKILPEPFGADPDRVARFRREAKVLGSLNHPHIATIYGLEDAADLKALVMELVEGEDLAQRLARGPMPLDEALPVARQIAEALEAAHEHGIVHRDLKPANIKLRSDGTVKVLDFGLAKALDHPSDSGVDMTASPTITAPPRTLSGLIVGTARYMSPEQARGRPVDKRTDIWAFGCVLYELLTGRAAFAGETLTDTLSAILERDPDWRALPDATPPNIHRLIQRCLAKDPKRRLHDAADARLEIDDALVIPVPGTSAGTTASPGSRPRVWRAGLIGIAVGAASTLLMIELVERLRPIEPPAYHQLTFRRGSVSGARFTPDGQTVVYSAAWEGAPVGLFATRLDNPESTSMPLASADLLAISPSAKMAIRLRDGRRTLAEVSLAGGAPRGLLNDVEDADWAPRADALAVAHVVDGRARLEYPAGKLLYRDTR